VFISKATFALPVYRWPATAQVIEEIARWSGSIGETQPGLDAAVQCTGQGAAGSGEAAYVCAWCSCTVPSTRWSGSG
jgi:hypothetical protein